MKKINCWEFTKCGREPGGEKVDLLGICPATVEKKADGIHAGEKGGRVCWAIQSTFCDGEVQGVHTAKLVKCLDCDFYKLVKDEEGKDLIATIDIVKVLNDK